MQIIKAFSSCVNFEKAMFKELSSEFEKIQSVGNQSIFKISQIPKIVGSISGSFENYTEFYVMQEEKELNEKIQKEL